MDFKELTYVMALARYQNITRAAQSLYLSQPALTRFLQRLGSTLGQPLFNRLGNRLVLTYAGKIYVAKAQEILMMKKELDETMQDIARSHCGHLRIGLSVFRASSFLAGVLPAFSRQYPNVQIVIEENDSVALENALCSGDLDLAFFPLPAKRPEIVTEILRSEELLLMLPPHDPIAGCAQTRPDFRFPWLDLALLKNHRFILQKKDQRTRQIIDKLFHDNNFVPERILEIQNIEVAVSLTVAGYGCSFTRDVHLSQLSVAGAAPQCFSVGHQRTFSDYAAAYRQGMYLPDYARDFIRLVRQQLNAESDNHPKTDDHAAVQ